MDFITSLAKVTIFVFPFVGLELYGFEFVFSLFIFFCMLSITDTLIGIYIAKRKKTISSRVGSEGFWAKMIWVMFFMIMTVGIAHMAYTIHNDSITARLSLIVICLYAIRILFEFVSVIENLAIISGNRERGFLNWIISLFTGVIGIGQKRIKEKLERYVGQIDYERDRIHSKERDDLFDKQTDENIVATDKKEEII